MAGFTPDGGKPSLTGSPAPRRRGLGWQAATMVGGGGNSIAGRAKVNGGMDEIGSVECRTQNEEFRMKKYLNHSQFFVLHSAFCIPSEASVDGAQGRN